MKAKRQPRPSYVPLDELLERPRVRILRVARFSDWILGRDLVEAAGAPDYEGDKCERRAWTQALMRLHRSGSLERCGKFPEYEYRITPQGIDEWREVFRVPQDQAA